MRIRAALFPYSAKLFPAVKYMDSLNSNYEIKRIIAPTALSDIGKDAAYILNLPDIGISISSSLGERKDDWDTLITFDLDELDSDLVSQQISFIELALNTGKSVCYISSENTPASIKALAKTYSDQMNIVNAVPDKINLVYSPENAIKPIQSLVVLVGGLVDDSDVQSVLFGMDVFLKKAGHNTLVISDSPFGPLFGHFSLQHIISNTHMDEYDKVCAINSQIYSWEKKYLPEVILIQAPDAFARYSNAAPTSFGIKSYMLTQAVSIDHLICCVPCEMAMQEFLKAVSKDFKVRYGCSIDAVEISNAVIDSTSVTEKHRMSRTYTTLEDVDTYFNNHYSYPESIPTFNVHKPNHVAALCDLLFQIAKLEAQNDEPSVDLSNCLSNRETVTSKVLSILNIKFQVPKDSLTQDFWDSPLTGRPFFFSSELMVELLLEIERTFHIIVSHEWLSNYRFNSICDIIGILLAAEQNLNSK